MTPSGQPGLFLKYIIRDAATVAKATQLKKREKEEQNEEERAEKLLEDQIAKARKAAIAAGPSRAKSAPRSLRRALLMPQANPGSRYRCGKRT